MEQLLESVQMQDRMGMLFLELMLLMQHGEIIMLLQLVVGHYLMIMQEIQILLLDTNLCFRLGIIHLLIIQV